jgi:dipeptidyl aminopeptidase/acylaminoacyl peptidase
MTRFSALSLLLLLGPLAAVCRGDDASAGAFPYMQPDSDIVRAVDAPWPPGVSLSPDYSYMLLRTSLRNPPISELAEPELRLAGLRFRPGNSAPSRSGHFVDLELVRLAGLEPVELSGLPAEYRVLRTAWSPDGGRIALTMETGVGVELWVIEAGTGEAGRLTGPVVSLVADVWPAWLSDSGTILFCMIPEGRGGPPEESPVPAGPVLQETSGGESPVRTYQDLLENPFDEELFEYYMTTELESVDMSCSLSTIAGPGMIWDFDPSPDGRFVILSTLNRPFSYTVTADRFAETVRVITMDGKPVRTIADLPVRDRIPLAIGWVGAGPRPVAWRSDADATLCWAEALDGGDAGADAEYRDAVMVLEAPFDGEPSLFARTGLRYGGIDWSGDSLAILYEWWWPTRQERMWRVRPGDPSVPPEPILDFSWEDRYNDPGRLVTRQDARGRRLVLVSDGAVYLTGEGASPEGDRPFLDRLDLSSLSKTRLFHSQPPYFERPYSFTDPEGRFLLFSRESVSEYPDYYVRDLDTGFDMRLSHSENPAPEYIGLQKELITYPREDGVILSATVYLPPGYDLSDGPLPTIMWAYPDEYVSADAAGQVSGSPYRFDYIGWWSPLVWLIRGYAVVMDPAMPIIAREGGQPDDRFVEELVMDAEAIVDEVVGRGIADPARMAIGGHSYGAFMTANLLAHSDLFAAGIAQTGAYNRTLTPFGFQSEDRSLWEAPEVYWEMSPFMHADGIGEPILLIHGEADDNSGTFPMQSERMFAAISGLGGTARLVMLPLEGHGYRSRESILHVLWEIERWLDMYVKSR